MSVQRQHLLRLSIWLSLVAVAVETLTAQHSTAVVAVLAVIVHR
jgi:hypothetical protein